MGTNRVIIYCDGGSRGNPGPAALGVVIHANGKRMSANDMRIEKEYSQYLGETTNNAAEYSAVVFALKKLKSLLGGEKSAETAVEIRSDSELVMRQLRGEYKLKEKDLMPLFVDIWNLRQDFGMVQFTHVPREENHDADRLVNRELDAATRKGLFQ